MSELIEQYSDFALIAEDGALVTDRLGAPYTGPAKLYVASPAQVTADVTPVSVSVVAGVWQPVIINAPIDGVWTAQIRAEGETKGSSPVLRFTVVPSPFSAPAVTP